MAACLGVLGIGAATGLLSYGFLAWSTSGELRAEKAEARREGLPLEPADLRRPVPDAENAAPIYRAAFAALDTVREPSAGETAAKLVSQHHPESPLWQSQVTRFVEARRSGLRTFLKAAALPYDSVDREWSKGGGLLFEDLGAHKAAMKDVILEARLRGAKGDVAGAFGLLAAAAHGARHSGDAQAGLVGKLVQISEDNAILLAAGEMLGERGLSPGVAEQAEKMLDALDVPINLKPAYGEELVLERETLRRFSEGRRVGALSTLPSGTEAAGYYRFLAATTRVGAFRDAFDAQLIRFWRDMAHALPADPDDSWTGYSRLRAAEERFMRRHGWKTVFAEMVTPVVNDAERAVGVMIERRRALRAMLAALRLRQTTGRFPKRLPLDGKNAIDPLSERPLAYRLTKDGFVVYGVGRNCFDDGGANLDTLAQSDDVGFAYPYVPPDLRSMASSPSLGASR